MIGALLLLPFLAYCLWLGVASIKPRQCHNSASPPHPTARRVQRTSSRDEPEAIRPPVVAEPVWTDLDELQLNRLLGGGSPPAAPPGAVH